MERETCVYVSIHNKNSCLILDLNTTEIISKVLWPEKKDHQKFSKSFNPYEEKRNIE